MNKLKQMIITAVRLESISWSKYGDPVYEVEDKYEYVIFLP